MAPGQLAADKDMERYLTQIKKILDTYFGENSTKVYLYGSRARGESHSASDIDLAVQSSEVLTHELSRAKEAFFESHIPYKIDLINLDTVDKQLKKSIRKEGVLIWES